VAKAVPAPQGRSRLPVAPSRSGGRVGLAEYLRGVWDELRKVVWPTRDELSRMTGIVVATVILFAVLIGGADYVLSLGVKQVYSGAANSTTTTTTNPAISPGASAAPRISIPASAAPNASAPARSAGATPLP
jgi:preprotein translocase subunit SecE